MTNRVNNIHFASADNVHMMRVLSHARRGVGAMTFKISPNNLPGVQGAKDLLNAARTTAAKAVNTATSAAGNGVHTAVATASSVADGFEQTAQKAKATVQIAGTNIFGNGADKPYDGKLVGANGKTYPANTPLSQIPHVTPQGTPRTGETVIYINGIHDTKQVQDFTMQAIANKTGDDVIGIHNATEGAVADLTQCLADKADKGNNPAVDTLTNALYTELKAGHDVHLMAHSQGGLITARALSHLQNRLMVEDGMSKADTEKLLGHLKIETFGSAGGHYIDGPQYVHYVGAHDSVPNLFGVHAPGAYEGRGAQLKVIPETTWDPIQAHKIDTTYMNARVPFADARQGDFSHPRPGA